jgi:hypothetical protein
MSRLKRIVVVKFIVLAFLIMTVGYAMAGEKKKLKAHGASINVKFEKIEVGDEEGHLIAIVENKQVWFSDTTGEKFHGISKGHMDMNVKTGEWSGRGYSISYRKDGNKVGAWEGGSVGKGRSQGTFKWIKGTGKYKGIKGGGTWKNYSLAPGYAYGELEYEEEIPTQ